MEGSICKQNSALSTEEGPISRSSRRPPVGQTQLFPNPGDHSAKGHEGMFIYSCLPLVPSGMDA